MHDDYWDGLGTTGTASGRDWGLRDLLAGLVLVAGLGLAGTGSCDGCAPWHPLLIVTPLLGGFSLVLLGGYLLYRR